MNHNQLKFIEFFSQIPDHRIDRRKLHQVEEILLVTICGMIAGCDSWADLELFGKTKLSMLRNYLPFKNGQPSDDTLRRFFQVLNPEIFEKCFIEWIESFQLELADRVIAIDGKTSRRSFDGNNRAMHLISAFVSELNMTMGQLKTSEKSNEITAIPQLLELIDIAGAVVTIDAMGCQTKVVEKIIEQQANYVIGLKGNQANLHDDVRTTFADPPKQMQFITSESHDKAHGRIETRRCTVTEDIAWLQQQYPQWKYLNSIVEIESQRIIKDKLSIEKRYYISSLSADPEILLSAIRQHWKIENTLHWVLDITFHDDHSRIRKGHAPRNIATIKKTVLNLLQMVKKKKPTISLKRMRKLAGWDQSFLDQVLTATF